MASLRRAHPSGMAALVSGELDVYDVASGSLVPAALSGADLVLIASDSNRTIFGLITTPDLVVPSDLRGKAQAVDAGVVAFQVFPEHVAQGRGQRTQAAVVQRRLSFSQVVHEQVTHRLAGELVAVDELFAGQRPRRCAPGAWRHRSRSPCGR